MTLLDACSVIAQLGIGMLIAALVLAMIRKILMRRGKQHTEIMKRIQKILLIGGVSFFLLASILIFGQASQANQ